MDTKKALMLSGGDGYIDFRLGLYLLKKFLSYKFLGEEEEKNDEVGKEQVRVRDLAHLLVWETECPLAHLVGESYKPKA